MSLYYDAASVLTVSTKQGSLKSRIYAKDANLKSKPAHVYALISEAAKYDVFLKEVIDNAGILHHEHKLTTLLVLLLTHDHFFARGGIAAGSSHPLRQSIERHKARLQSEFTKARLKRRISTIEQLKAAILKEKGIIGRVHPRWARINTLKSSLDESVKRSFGGHAAVDSIEVVMTAGKDANIFYYDVNIPNLLAFPPEVDLTKQLAYQNGEIILQDKASCFPAHLLFGTDAESKGSRVGGAMDGCAAPGNKTTHMAALVHGTGVQIYACERDVVRSKTLQMMVDKAGAGKTVTVLPRQDFLALRPQDSRFQQVTHLLLDPSCSGSGILGREDIPKLALPEDPRKTGTQRQSTSSSQKRKRGNTQHPHAAEQEEEEDSDSPTDKIDPTSEQQPLMATKARLEKLSYLQSRIVEHAFSFPAATRATYSTCSIHVEENEAVVARVLNSTIGKSRGWRVLKREDQVHGLRIWKHRGVKGDHALSQEQREACIRCTPEDGEGTMGFFVCGFVRDAFDTDVQGFSTVPGQHENKAAEEWEGFSDT